MIVFLIVVGVIITLMVRRARRKATLAGLVAEKPAFHIEPPTRRHGSRKTEAL